MIPKHEIMEMDRESSSTNTTKVLSLEVMCDIRDALVEISSHLRNANDIANRLLEDKE